MSRFVAGFVGFVSFPAPRRRALRLEML